MELNSCRPIRKPLVWVITVKNDPNLLSSINIGLLSSGEMSCGLMSQDAAYSRTISLPLFGREPHEAMDPSCIVPTEQANGGSVMIWGCFSESGLGSAILCDNKMKSQHYLNVLNDQVIPLMDCFLPRWNWRISGRQCQYPPSTNYSVLSIIRARIIRFTDYPCSFRTHKTI
ncbi:hypothetical protein AVEN_72346-1 [Araneus ventricosus]|uniref:Uncharacterized protein n=1 Tax=Araneus ventricosus TaxID=182803 RepID=A0A4Y2JQZ1_ARAVE|nr:hypothetical protein AVEN_72346-1 [Araneus ventricosus]